MIVVLALLGMLLLIGFMFYTVSNQEQANAEYFVKALRDTGVGGTGGTSFNPAFDVPLRQITIGPGTDETNSALWGGRHTLLAIMFGRDSHAFTGEGVNIISDGAGNYAVDQNYDGIPDDGTNGQPDNRNLLDFSDSPAAWQALPPQRREPDVDYTYPDINNVFLAYHGVALTSNNLPLRVVIPSFHRPALLRQQNAADNEFRLARNWYQEPSLAARVMRPHYEHQDMTPNGSNPVPLGRRFLRPTDNWQQLGASGPFPFTPDYPYEGLPNGGGAEQGVWSLGSWEPQTVYRLGEWCLPRFNAPGNAPRGTLFYRCTSANDPNPNNPNIEAQSGGSEPAVWPDVVGGQVTDGDLVWTAYATMTTNYEYDADPDGDGIREAVYLDLDAAPLLLSDGKWTIPLFAITIYDADGLLNLNAHGNVEGLVNLRTGSPFGGGSFLSRSNQGRSPAEVNVQWGLNAVPNPVVPGNRFAGDMSPRDDNPADVFRQHGLFYDHVPVDSREAANMEWWYANAGKVQFQGSASPGTITDIFTGRYGEQAGLLSATTFVITNPPDPSFDRYRFPQPGRSFDPFDPNTAAALAAADDNQNRSYGEPSQATLGLYRSGHPLDFRGFGSLTSLTAAPPSKQPQFYSYSQQVAGNPNRWLMYTDFSRQGMFNKRPDWATYVFGNLMVDSGTDPSAANRIDNPLTDEPAELESDHLRTQTEDQRFEIADSAVLAMSSADINNTGLNSRLLKLMEFNFQRNVRANQIRKRFTTVSADLPTFAGGVDETEWVNVPNGPRRWEWQDLANPTQSPPLIGPLQFPPLLSTYGPLLPQSQEPLRPAVEELLRTRLEQFIAGPNERRRRQRKLSVNHLVEASGILIAARPLRPHADPTVNAPVDPSTNQILNMVAISPEEFNARRDRQQLARDIYALLYLFCGGIDQVPPSNPLLPSRGYYEDNQNRTLYDDQQLRAMAQFAVNLVDALDPDDVITRFEYDKNLGVTEVAGAPVMSGWNLDDDPDSRDSVLWAPGNAPGNDPDYPEDTVERGVVYGVEAQQLTFGESMLVQTIAQGNNDTKTLYNDQQEHYFTYIELRNVLPREVALSTAVAQTQAHRQRVTWRIRRSDDVNSILFLHQAGSMPASNAAVWGHGIAAGEQFVIASSDGDAPNQNQNNRQYPSDFRFDYDADGLFDLIAPFVADPADPADPDDPAADLDLVHGQDGLMPPDELFVLDNGSYGSFINRLNAPTGNIELVLERKMHLGLPRVPLANNPWIEVDRIELQISSFDVSQAPPQAMQTVRSTERGEAFDRATEQYFPVGNSTDSVHYNSLGQPRNTNSQQDFRLTQQHLDREFASIVEVFQLPLYGPKDVTSRLKDHLDVAAPNSAGPARFLRPVHPNNVQNAMADPRLDNRWYRLLEFIEVPRFDHLVLNPGTGVWEVRYDTDASGQPGRIRQVGRINWNTIRHPAVLAGLIDDGAAFDGFFPWIAGSMQTEYLRDTFEGTTRDWWTQFIGSRDGGGNPNFADPVTSLRLPGTAEAVPFRSFNALGDGWRSIDQTMLRGLPNDPATDSVGNDLDPATRRRLFDLATSSEHTTRQYDPRVKHRVLSKMLNNSTTRSNVFFVFIEVDYFELVRDPNTGAEMIGAKREDSPGHRGFFVVDRSRAYEDLKQADFADAADPAAYRFKDGLLEGGFDWRSLVVHSQRIE